MRERRWIEAHPQALRRIARAVSGGELGQGVRFLALRSAPGFDGRGVLDELAEYGGERAQAVVGEFDEVACAHDGLGGPEAEAHLRLGNAAAAGLLVLSRLRPLRDGIEVAGERGRIVLDRRGRLRSHPPELLERVAARPANRSSAGVFTYGRDLRTGAARLRHPWELEDSRAFPQLPGRRVLVTGATGFIGARVVERLAECGAEVTAGVRSAARAARIARLGVRLASMSPGTDLMALLRGHDAVVNLAHDLQAPASSNSSVSLAIADACEAVGVPLLVQASSIAVYDGWPDSALDEAGPADGPGSPYKQLKRAIERDLEARAAAGRLRSVILQPTIVYGAFSALWTDRFAERLRIGDVAVPVGGLCHGVHADDVADAVLAAIASPSARGRIIVSGPAAFAWPELLAPFAGACRGWGEVKVQPAVAPLPMPAATHPLGRAALLRAALERTAWQTARRWLGEDAVARLRDRILITAARGARPVYRPAAESPRLFAARAPISTARMHRELVPPRIDGGRGAELVRAYLRWRYCPFPEGPAPPV